MSAAWNAIDRACRVWGFWFFLNVAMCVVACFQMAAHASGPFGSPYWGNAVAAAFFFNWAISDARKWIERKVAA